MEVPRGATASPQSATQHVQASRAPEKILFQKFFKSIGPRTYAAQIKESANGNHALVLIEGKRDKQTGEVRKSKLYVWSEDFPAFLDMLSVIGQFIQANPVPEAVRHRQAAFWKRGGKPKFRPKRP